MTKEGPDFNEIEINLFGGGNAYGEAVLIHLGNNLWIAIDSIKNPRSEKSISLEYLKEIGVDPQSIKLIVASHWHDDHIKGLSDIYRESKSKLAISQAISKDYMAKLISIDEFKDSKNSGLKEFGAVIRRSIDEKDALIRAIQDRTLFTCNEAGFNIKITALSPSDKSIEVFEQEMADVLNRAYNLNLAARKINPNHSSVVLLIEVGATKILLGSDLEISTKPGMGWKQVVRANSTPLNNRVEIFKIPHHGSRNGHFEKVWSDILTAAPISILTPYGKGRKKLPSTSDVNRILHLAPSSYITSKIHAPSKPKKRNSKVGKILNELSFKVKERKFSYGHIRLRKKNHQNSNEKWRVDLFGEACELQELL